MEPEDGVGVSVEQPLSDIFLAAERGVQRKRANNLFEELSERCLTQEEQDIIRERVENQRRLLAEYEKRERTRKLRELCAVAPDLSERAALRALELCRGSEDDAVLRLTEEPAFKRRCIADAGDAPRAVAVVDAAQAAAAVAAHGKAWTLGPLQADGSIFCGRFRSKLGPYQLSSVRPVTPPRAAAAAALAESPAAAAALSAGAIEGAQAEAQADVARLSTVAGGGGPQPALPGDAAAAVVAQEAGREEGAAAGVCTAAQGSGTMDCSQTAGTAALECTDSAPAAAGSSSQDEPHQAVLPAADGVGPAGIGAMGAGVNHSTNTASAPMAPGAQPAQPLRPRAASALARQISRLDLVLQLERLSEAAERHPGAPDQILDCLRSDMGLHDHAAALATAWEVQQAALEADAAEVCRRRATGAVGGPGASAYGQRHEERQQAMAAARSPQQHPRPQQQQEQQEQEQQPFSLDEAQLQSTRPSSAVAPPVGVSFSQPPRSASASSEAAKKQQTQQQQQQQQLLQWEQRLASGQSSGPGPGCEPDEPWRGARVPRGRRSQRRRRQVFAADILGNGAPWADAAAEPPNSRGAREPGPTHASQPGTQCAGEGCMNVGSGATTGDDSAPTAESGPASDGQPEPRRSGRSRRLTAAAGPDQAAAPGGGVLLVASRSSLGGGARAVNPVTGHTCRGRVRQKSHKNTELVQLGTLMVGRGWHNAGYIFPAGFKSRLLFRSSVDLDSLTPHECEVVGEGGAFWPAPTFVVTARDRPDEPMVARSCTGCWSGILKRIRGEIEARRAAGEDLPPAPKTAIAGPEYFGLNDAGVTAAVEALDPDHLCSEYWAGKRQRDAALLLQQQQQGAVGGSSGAGTTGAVGTSGAAPPDGTPSTAAAAGAAAAGGSSAKGSGARQRNKQQQRRRGGWASGGGGEGGDDEDDPEAAFRGNHWSALSRRDRYRARTAAAAAAGNSSLAASAEAGPAGGPQLTPSLLPPPPVDADEDNPLPGLVDPVTLEPVVAPAISPYGHVMGLATWRAVLADARRCPFTKQPLQLEQLVALTWGNIERYREMIVRI